MIEIVCLHRWDHYFFSKLDAPMVRCLTCGQRGDPYLTLDEMRKKPSDYPRTVIGRTDENKN